MSEQDGTITGAQSLIRSLENAGVTDIFGIPGGTILPARTWIPCRWSP